MTACTGVTRRRLVAALAGLAGCALIGGRIGYVNANPPVRIPVARHALGERVDLDGAFTASVDVENTAGYSITVLSAALRSYNEYIALHANDGSELVEGLDVPSIVDLEWEIQNVGNDTGNLFIFGMNLTPERANMYYLRDDGLLRSGQEKMRGNPPNPGLYINIRPDTTYRLSMPYVHNSFLPIKFNGADIQQQWTMPITDTRFELRLSNYPVRHVVEIEL